MLFHGVIDCTSADVVSLRLLILYYAATVATPVCLRLFARCRYDVYADDDTFYALFVVRLRHFVCFHAASLIATTAPYAPRAMMLFDFV